MPKSTKSAGETEEPKRRTARSDKQRDRRLVNMATDLVEERMRTGKATAAEIIHYLRLGSPERRLEQDLLKEKTKMVKAKTRAIQTGERLEKLYLGAQKAMQSYQYSAPEDDTEEEYE